MEKGYVRVVASVIQSGNPGKCTPVSTQLVQYRNGFKFRFDVYWEGFCSLHQEGKHHTQPLPIKLGSAMKKKVLMKSAP